MGHARKVIGLQRKSSVNNGARFNGIPGLRTCSEGSADELEGSGEGALAKRKRKDSMSGRQTSEICTQFFSKTVAVRAVFFDV